jgi:carbon storage regulator CsrA
MQTAAAFGTRAASSVQRNGKQDAPKCQGDNAMLVLTRKTQEQIQIGHSIKVTVVRIKGRSVRLGIEAPDNVRIVRGELAEAMAEFRDDPEGDVEMEGEEFEETTSEPKGALHSADEEDETIVPQVKLAASSSPLGKITGDVRPAPLRRPARLGPACLRRMSCR